MSIENNLASIAKSLETIAFALTGLNARVGTVPAEHAPLPQPAPAPVQAPTPAPVAVVQPVHAPIQAPAAVMPPPPFAVPSAPSVAVPFNDSKTLITWVTTAYKALGAEKGARIGEVLASLGHKNINDVRPDQYAVLYAGIEGLK